MRDNLTTTTAKHRARSLVLTYLDMFSFSDDEKSFETALFLAKKAARACVDIVLEIQNYYDDRGEEMRFWRNVYKEIEFVR